MEKKPAILIVDDRRENLLVLERILERSDTVIVKARSGNEALKACLNHDFALALLDVNMPEMNGFELAELMRGEKRLSRVPIIFLTAAYTEKHQIFQGYSSGAVDYLVKPLQPEILLNKVEVFLDIFRQREELQRLNRDLQAAREEADSANRAKSAFLANMSHEIRTPMNAVLGLTDLTLSTELNRQQREYLELIKTSAESLLEVINDILDFSRIEAGKLHLVDAPFEIREVVEKTVRTLAVRSHEKGLELLCRIDPAVPPVLVGDAGRLRQILTNLVGNAVKFTESGEIQVQVEALPEGKPQRLTLRFSVTDTGIGIPHDKLNRLFKSFSQVDSSLSRKYGGSGLGLDISARLVEMMGGAIGVESVEGKGSTFTFRLPFSVAGTREPASSFASGGEKPENPLNPEIAGLRILLAEDNDINQRLALALLKQRGWEATAVRNGREALRALRTDRYDLVLMDVQMPEMDGLEATRRIREEEKGRGGHIPVIGLTAGAFAEDRERCLEAGMDDYLPKPFKAKEFLEVVASHAQPLGASPSSEESGPAVDLSDSLRSVGGSKEFLAESGPEIPRGPASDPREAPGGLAEERRQVAGA